MLQKYAATQILGARIFDGRSASIMRTAHRAEFEYTPKHGYLYVRSRMISSRCNDNFDEFPSQDIQDGYLTFLGKPVFVNHHNEDHRRMRGLIVDAALHKDANLDGSPDTWVEGLQEVDALTFPKLAAAILAGKIDRTSMGVDVAFSVCAVCSNKATTPLEYCRHIPAMKGTRVLRRTASGEHVSTLTRERCHGLSFFENSLLVEEPADPTAFFLGEPQRGPGLEHLGMSITTDRQVPPSIAYIVPNLRTTASRSPMNAPALPQISAGLKFVHGGRCPGCASLDTIASLDGAADCFDCESSFRTARVHETEPLAPLVPHKPVKEMDKPESAEWNKKVKAHADEWHGRNPPSTDNIVDHWHAASADEKDAGKTWYPDAHHATKMLADHSGTPMHVAAGLMSNYSPQTHWATNIITAATAMRTGRAVGGKGNKDAPPGVDKAGQPVPKGFKTTDSQRDVAHDMLTNHTHYNDVFTGPKTRAFAHLIHHGGDSAEDLAKGEHRVCVDRHAMSVACGARMPDSAYGHAGLGGKKKYGQLADMYHEAAKKISDHEGEEIHPHQVQAATWLVRQRLNEHHDRELGIDGSRAAGNARTAIHQMNQYFGEHHPEMSIQMPGTGYSKAGAPATPLEKAHHEDHAKPGGAMANRAAPAAPPSPPQGPRPPQPGRPVAGSRRGR